MAATVSNSTNVELNTYSFHNFGHKLSNFLTTMVPMTFLTGLCVAIGAAFGSTLAMVLSLGVATAINFTIYYFSADIVLSLYDAKQLDLKDENQKALDEVVTELAKEYAIPKPIVNIVNKSYINAFATGRNPENAAVVATQGLLSRLKLDKKYDDKVMPSSNFITKRELKAIFAHELGHVINYDMAVSTFVAVLTGSIGILADHMRAIALYGKSEEEDSFLGRFSIWLVAAIVPTLATILQFIISRARESQADCTGAELMGEGSSLASALKKISRFSTEMIDGTKEPRHEYPTADMGFIESTKFLFIAEPNVNEILDLKQKITSESPFDVKELNDPNTDWISWGFSWFSSHPSTKQRIEALELIDNNLSKKAFKN